jgi:putative ABC transport system permease protein
MRPGALLYLYRRRLRTHGVQECLAGLGVAIAVALVFATILVSSSITGSAAAVVRTVTGPATLQLRARGSDGFDEQLLARVERLPGVLRAAPLLEQTATVQSANGRRLTVDLAGANTSLVVLDGLAHRLPTATLTASGLGLSRASARALAIAGPSTAQAGSAADAGVGTGVGSGPETGSGTGMGSVLLLLRGRALHLAISAVLGPESFGALSQAYVAVMPLADLQRRAGLQGRITRILVQAQPGREAAVRRELRALAGGGLEVAAADQDVALLGQALGPSDQASALFAAISVLLGVLLVFNALLLTVPERRLAIAELRLIGAKPSAIVQMLLFQALCLGLAASLVGLLAGYVLAREVFHQSTGYLAEAFTLGTQTVLTARPLLLALLAGLSATVLASAAPLLDLRHTRALDAIYRESGVPGNTLSPGLQRGSGIAAGALLVAASVLFLATPALALSACVLLALASVLAVPLTFGAVLRAAQALCDRLQELTILPVALSSLRSTTLRSLALAATGSVALFGSVALGESRADLLHGIEGFAHSYSADASIWVGAPGDNQATVDFRADGLTRRISRLDGVAGVRAFQGGFLTLDGRRVWIIARPPGAQREVLRSQISAGGVARAVTRLGEGGWIAVSKQIASEHHAGIGDTLRLPTPTGPAPLRIAATTTNLAWSPGVIFIDSADYVRLWQQRAPTALGVQLAPGANVVRVRAEIERILGAGTGDDSRAGNGAVASTDSGVVASTAREREASIDTLTGEGLGQLGEISTLLLIAAILAMAAALTSAIWQRRKSLAALRLSGVTPRRMRLILLVESALILGAGCVTGALAGIYGQVIIDAYLQHVTGFPVTRLGAGVRPLEILALVSVVVLAIVAVPGWLASRVSPTLALNE